MIIGPATRPAPSAFTATETRRRLPARPWRTTACVTSAQGSVLHAGHLAGSGRASRERIASAKRNDVGSLCIVHHQDGGQSRPGSGSASKSALRNGIGAIARDSAGIPASRRTLRCRRHTRPRQQQAARAAARSRPHRERSRPQARGDIAARRPPPPSGTARRSPRPEAPRCRPACSSGTCPPAGAGRRCTRWLPTPRSCASDSGASPRARRTALTVAQRHVVEALRLARADVEDAARSSGWSRKKRFTFTASSTLTKSRHLLAGAVAGAALEEAHAPLLQVLVEEMEGDRGHAPLVGLARPVDVEVAEARDLRRAPGEPAAHHLVEEELRVAVHVERRLVLARLAEDAARRRRPRPTRRR